MTSKPKSKARTYKAKSKPRKYKFQWWHAAIVVATVAVIGVLVVRFSRASTTLTVNNAVPNKYGFSVAVTSASGITSGCEDLYSKLVDAEPSYVSFVGRFFAGKEGCDLLQAGGVQVEGLEPYNAQLGQSYVENGTSVTYVTGGGNAGYCLIGVSSSENFPSIASVPRISLARYPMFDCHLWPDFVQKAKDQGIDISQIKSTSVVPQPPSQPKPQPAPSKNPVKGENDGRWTTQVIGGVTWWSNPSLSGICVQYDYRSDHFAVDNPSFCNALVRQAQCGKIDFNNIPPECDPTGRLRGAKAFVDQYNINQEQPKGTIDYVDCKTHRVVGWVFDPSNGNISSTAHIYVDGRAGETGNLKIVSTNPVSRNSQDRPDVNNAYNIVGRHGFNYLLPNSLFDGKQHSLTLYGINIGANGIPAFGGVNPDLGTKTFNCPASTVFK